LSPFGQTTQSWSCAWWTLRKWFHKISPIISRPLALLHWRYYHVYPVPLKFAKGGYESGLATKALRGFAEDPFPLLSGEEKARMTAAHAALSRKFDELAFDESAAVRWQEAQPSEVDNIDVGPATETDLQNDLIESSANPF
jgi:hypothetical protein